MSSAVLCLRPEADFTRVGASAPADLRVTYLAPDNAELPSLLRQAQALVIPAVGPKLPADLFKGASLRLVQVTGAGVDRLDADAMKTLGIPVANVPGGSNAAVAEYAVTTAAMLLRRLAWSNTAIRGGDYVGFRARMLADNLGGLDGLLVGVVGLGTIGRAVAQAFARAGARIAYYDPAPAGSPLPDAQALPLDDLIATADVVTLHVPLLPATRDLIGAAQLRRMKPGAVLINASRGGIVDEQALAEALRAGHLGGAAVDVYSVEPPTADNPLLSVDGDAANRLILTPHIAGVTRQASAFLFGSAWENVARVLLRGEAPLHRVY